ncbi:MAG: hypothetical protein IID36_05030 [Planctomycetes bacterium]|nr:hypothetical protein [Planctomycetota bacterium]
MADTIWVDIGTSCTMDCRGQDFEHAIKGLPDALRAVESLFAQLWVVAGTYKPTTGTTRTASIGLLDGVGIYGGFDGSETVLGDRDFVNNVTILSGDVGTGDADSYHVVNGSGTASSAALDGFTITGGFADGTSPNNKGGGMYNSAGDPTVVNCIFTGNTAVSGGAVYNNVASPDFTDCTFESNTATQAGGAVFNRGAGAPSFTSCVFRSNTADGGGATEDGGAMYNGGNDPTLVNCLFYDNTANDDGAAMYNTDADPTITNCTFVDNVAVGTSGGVYNGGSSAPTITNSILWGNDDGGSVVQDAQIKDAGSGSSIVTYCDIQDATPGATPFPFGGSSNNNIDTDPMFVKASTDNYHIVSGSGVIDTGNNSAISETTDLDGLTRKVDSGGGVTVDMGPYEMQGEGCNAQPII